MRIVETLRKVADSWGDITSGLGISGRDRGAGGGWVDGGMGILPLNDLATMFHDDFMARIVATVFPEEALRRGIHLDNPEASAMFDRLNLRGSLQEGASWGRAFGGAVGVMFLDGDPLDVPLSSAGPFKLRRIDIYDRRNVERMVGPETINGLIHAEFFRISPSAGRSFVVHRDRLLIFGGVLTGKNEREANAGWDHAAIQPAADALRSFGMAHTGLRSMLADASTGILKIKGYFSSLTEKGGKEAMATRASMVDLTRSVSRTMFLDADEGEDFQKVATQFSGVPDAVDRFVNLVAAATRIPVAILMGQAPAGLNATGETDLRSFYDRVESYREFEIEPHVKRILSLTFPGTRISWPSLWQPTAKEAAETDKLRADRDVALVGAEIITREEAATKYASEFGIDMNTRIPGGTPTNP